eukprot:GDKI01049524.1.p1 GENE.GDKI01049524.1~~GDKI01049524.1.p1  ORF type:complete len:284 (+),score=75.18 GDKI01049524.1:3-854(+)
MLEAKPLPLVYSEPLRAESHGVSKPRSRDIEVHSLCNFPYETPLPDLAYMNHKSYAEIHGYKYFMHRESVIPDREPHLSKMALVWRRFKNLGVTTFPATPGPEWLLWIDCDAFFTNLSLPLEGLIETYAPDQSGVDFVVAEDIAGINTGVLLFRNTPWTLDFLSEVFASPYSITWDQSMFFFAMYKSAYDTHTLSHGDFAVDPHIRLVHQSVMNSYTPGTAASWMAHGWQEGEFILHFAGCPSDQKQCVEEMVDAVSHSLQQVGMSVEQAAEYFSRRQQRDEL